MKFFNHKQFREQRKQLRKQAHYARDRGHKREDAGMIASAINIRTGFSISVENGTGAGDKYNPILRELETKYPKIIPWQNIEPALNSPHSRCAEAKLWLELVSRGYKPIEFIISTRNQFGKIAPPCRNCCQWTPGIFKAVEKADSEYRPNSRQRPR